MKKIITQYFSFTKKERTGTFVLLFLILFFILLPFFYSFFIKNKPTDSTSFEKEIAALKIKQQDSANKYVRKSFDEDNYQNYYQPSEKNYYDKIANGELFYFDPNTATTADWQKLGVKDKTITTIQKYLSKGGHFYKPEDIGKIWGLRQDEIKRMLPYIQIATKQNIYTPSSSPPATTYEKPKYTPTIIDINTADTSTLIALPGIGSKLSARIISFREKLGGFYSTNQVAETFGLPDSTFQKIKLRLTVNATVIKQFNINTATIDQMKTHPYIKYNIANAIVQYRNQHGNYTSLNDLKKIMTITDDIFNKIAPYCTLQ